MTVGIIVLQVRAMDAQRVVSTFMYIQYLDKT